MSDLMKIRKLYQLKNVNRLNSVQNRKESSAEHSWSCLILADYFLTILEKNGKQKIDRLKVYELLMYHDVVEIEAGDSGIVPGEDMSKNENELIAMKKLKEKIPKTLSKKYNDLFSEFEEGKTIESRFAKAIDKFDAIIHVLDYKKEWIVWTEKLLRKSKEKYFVEFPEIKNAFEEIVVYVNRNGYFEQ